jgi:hypothetical protein
VSSGLQVPVSLGIVVQEKDTFGDFSEAWRFSFNMSFKYTSRDK